MLARPNGCRRARSDGPMGRALPGGPRSRRPVPLARNSLWRPVRREPRNPRVFHTKLRSGPCRSPPSGPTLGGDQMTNALPANGGRDSLGGHPVIAHATRSRSLPLTRPRPPPPRRRASPGRHADRTAVHVAPPRPGPEAEWQAARAPAWRPQGIGRRPRKPPGRDQCVVAWQRGTLLLARNGPEPHGT